MSSKEELSTWNLGDTNFLLSFLENIDFLAFKNNADSIVEDYNRKGKEKAGEYFANKTLNQIAKKCTENHSNWSKGVTQSQRKLLDKLGHILHKEAGRISHESRRNKVSYEELSVSDNTDINKILIGLDRRIQSLENLIKNTK